MKIHQFIICASSVLFLPSVISGSISNSSAVVQEKYHFFSSAQFSYYDSEHVWNKNSEIKPAHDDFKKEHIQVYIEFGLTDYDTILAQLGWARVHETLNGRSFGFDDMKLGWKRHLCELYCHTIALELDAIVPLESDYDPGLCYGDYGVGLNILASKGFTLFEKYAWYDLRLGYLWYSGFPSDQILADVSFNYHPVSKLFLQLGAYVEYGVFNGHSRVDQSLFMYNPNYRLFKGRFEATYCFDNGVSLVAGYDRFLWGRNVGTGGEFYGGTQYQF